MASACGGCLKTRHPRERGCQEIPRADEFVVPAQAGTQEQATEILGSRFRGNDEQGAQACDVRNWITPRKRGRRAAAEALESGIPASAGMTGKL